MKKLITFIAILVLGCNVFAAFPTQLNQKTNDISQIRGSFNDFNLTWIAENDQSVEFWLTNNGTAQLVLDGYSQGFRLSKLGVIYVDVLPSAITAANEKVTFTVSRANIPPNATYDAELWTYTGAATNSARTLAQGKVNVRRSLYSDTNSFPFPTWDTNNLTSYMLIADYDTNDNDIVDNSDRLIAFEVEQGNTNAGFETRLDGLETTGAAHTVSITGLQSTQALVVTSLASVSSAVDTVEATVSTNVAKLNAASTFTDTNQFAATTYFADVEMGGDEIRFGAAGYMSQTIGAWSFFDANTNRAWNISKVFRKLYWTNGSDYIDFSKGFAFEGGVNVTGITDVAGINNVEELVTSRAVAEDLTKKLSLSGGTQDVDMNINAITNLDYLQLRNGQNISGNASNFTFGWGKSSLEISSSSAIALTVDGSGIRMDSSGNVTCAAPGLTAYPLNQGTGALASVSTAIPAGTIVPAWDLSSGTNISFPLDWSFTYTTTNNFDLPIPLGFLSQDITFSRAMTWDSAGTAYVDIIEYSTNGTTVIQTNYAGLLIVPIGSSLTAQTNFANATASQGNMLKASITNFTGVDRGNITLHSTYSN